MNCGRMGQRIQGCVDGTASPAEQEAVRAHAAGCPECAAALEQTRRLVRLLGSMPERRVSDGFESRLHGALQRAAPLPLAAAWWERARLYCEWRLRVPAMVAAGSAAMAVIAAVVTPQIAEYRAHQGERRAFVMTAVQHHRQLQQGDSQVDWTAVDVNIDLNTGSVVED